MQWRNIDYSVVQATGKPLWKWKVEISYRGIASRGEARSRTLAITAAVAAIEKICARQAGKESRGAVATDSGHDQMPKRQDQHI